MRRWGSGGRPRSEPRACSTWWRTRTADRSTRVEGRHLVKESQRILKKKSYRIPAGVAAQVQADIARRRAGAGRRRSRAAAQDDRRARRRHGRAPGLRPQVDRPRVLRVDRRGGGGGAAPARLRRRGLPDPVGLDDPDAGGRRPHLRLQVLLRAQHPLHRHQDPAVRRAQAGRRHRLQVAARPQHRLHQAGGRPAGRRHRDEAGGALHQRQAGPARAASARLRRRGGAPQRASSSRPTTASSGMETLGDVRHETIQEPGRGGRDFAAHRSCRRTSCS